MNDGGIWSSWQPPIGITVSGVTGHARDFTTAMDFDRANAPWVAGTGSVSRFDGARWRDYTHELTGGQLPLAAFWAITVDRNGVVWIGGAAGVTPLYPAR